MSTVAPVKKAFGIQWYTGTGCKQLVIDAACREHHRVVLGWTHPALGSRCYGSCQDLQTLLINMPHCEVTDDNRHGFPDLEGLYHTTLDKQLYPPYFDCEWVTETELAYPWVSLDGILADITAAMWHMFGVTLMQDDFCIANASGESGGTFKNSFHVLIRPASGPGIGLTKAQMKECWETCLKPKYTVQHPSAPDKSENIIDPAVYGHQFDFRAIYQSKPGGKRPLLPLTAHKSIVDFMLDYLPDGSSTPASRLRGAQLPPLPAQLVALAPPTGAGATWGAKAAREPCVGLPPKPRPAKVELDKAAALRAKEFAWLTAKGKLAVVSRVLEAADITDIRPIIIEGDGSIYCATNKRTGRACMCSRGERHVSNNVICRLCRDGRVYFTCLAPKAECRQPVAIGAWPEVVADPGALCTAQPALVSVNAVPEALHAMCSAGPGSKPASYQALKAVFEVAHFKVTTPLHFVRLTDASEQDTLIAEGYPVCTKAELRDTYSAIQYVGVKETRKGPVESSVPFVDCWLKDPKHRTYTKLDFLPPPLICGADVYNTFTGFDAERWNVADSGDIAVWKELLELACNCDATAAGILEVFFAQNIQQPGTNSEAGWATSSFAKGAGKDTLLEVIKLIMGGKYYCETASPLQELMGEHAVGLAHKLLVHVNESEDLRKSVGKVRHLITTKQLEINPKYMRQYKVRNLARWVVSGNEEGLVEHCRRWFQTSFSSKRVGDHKFWQRVHAWKADKRNLKAVYNHLKSLDLSNVKSMQALFAEHVTEATHHAALRAADNITHFLVQTVQERLAEAEEKRKGGLISGYSTAPERILSRDLYQEYETWGVENRLWKQGEPPSPNPIEFGRKISYRFARTGRKDPAMQHIAAMGKSRSSGFEINWARLYEELVAMHFINPMGEEDC